MSTTRTIVVERGFPCPKCSSPMFIRTSKPVNQLLREQYYFCSSETCDGKFKAVTELVSQLSNGTYDERINLPLATRKAAVPAAHDPRQLHLQGLDPP